MNNNEMVIKLSKTSKMPCKSWSTEAIKTCHRGAELSKVEGSVCSKCYACKGMYRFPVVKNARELNFKSYLSNPEDWTIQMIILLKKQPYFRFFDSGDIWNLEQLNHIIEIATAVPTCQFWLPTREIGILKDYFRKGGTIPSNLNIRISADMMNQEPCGDAKLLVNNGCTFSIVETEPNTTGMRNVKHCQATWKHEETEGKCGTCRNCWDKSVTTVSYKGH